MLAGGYTKFRPVTEEDVQIFNKAMNNLVGVNYEPLIVSTQVVNGTNYRFVCNAEMVTLKPVYYLALIAITKPLDSDPVITEINKMDD